MPRRTRRTPARPTSDRLAQGIVQVAEAAARRHEPAELQLGGAVSAARDYAEASRSPATRRAYRTAWQAFCGWCSGQEAPPGTQPLPASPALVAAYAARLAQLGRRPTTVSQAMAAISVAHQAAGHPSPTKTAEVRAVVAGVRRTHGAATSGKAALETPALREALSAIPEGTSRGIRDRALLLLGFAGGFRRSELVDLDLDDLQLVPEGLQVRLRRSKTDQEGRGRLVGIPYGLHGETCPVQAVQAWVQAAVISEGPLFRTVDGASRILPLRCSERAVARAVQRAVRASGGDPGKVGAHSLRSGFVTSAARAGAPVWAIQLQTGHRSLAQLHAYVRPATLFHGNAARYVGL